MASFEIGSKVSRSKTISAEDVETFANISGDHNPVHLDDQYAAGTRFGKRIAHGILTASVISALVANEFPGSIYLSQTLSFKAPVYLGDTVTATAELTQYRERSRVATFKTTCHNQDGQLLIEGEAVAMLPEQNP